MTEYLPPVVQKFDADMGGYIAKLAEGEAALDAYAKTSAKTSESVARDGAEAETALDGLASESSKTSRKVQQDNKDSGKSVSDFERLLSSKLQDGETALQTLQREMGTTKTRITDLKSEVAKTGDFNVFGDLTKAKSDLSKMEKIFGDLTQEGEKAGKTFMSGFSDKVSELGNSPIMWGAIASLAVGITPIIAGAVGAGFSAAVIGGGILALHNDPQIKAAATALKDTLSSTFKASAQPLLQPLVTGMSALKAGVMSLKPDLTGLFDAVAPDIAPLVDGLVGLAKDALPGFKSAAQAAQPIVAALGDDLPKLGFALGDFVDTLASAPGAINGVNGAFSILDGTLNVLGNTISFMSQDWVQTLFGMKAFEGLMSAMSDDPPKLAVIGVSMSKIAQVARDMGVSFDSTAAFTGRQDDALKKLIATQNDWMKTAQSNDDALLAMKQAQSTFSDELKKGSKNWNENTKAGQAQVGNLNALNEKITAYYGGLAALHPLTEKQTAAELKATSALYNQAKQAGATKGELGTLKGEVADLSKQLALLHGKTVTVNMVTHFITEGAKDPTQFHHGTATGGAFMRAAHGLVAGVLPAKSPGTVVLAGEPETHGEVFMPLAGISQQRAIGLASIVGDAYGFDIAPRGNSAGLLGVSAPATSGGGGGMGPIQLILNNQIMAQFHAAAIGPAQRYKARTGVTGLA